MKEFKEGDKVVVVDRIHGHRFDIGEVVKIDSVKPEDFLCINIFGDVWHLTEQEIKLVTTH